LSIVSPEEQVMIDCVVDGKLKQTGVISAGETEVLFEALEPKDKLVEIYLSQVHPVKLAGLWLDESSDLQTTEPKKFKWVTYGSSITQCAGAESPSQTWPALAAEELGLDLTCLGFGANCHMEPM